MERERALKLDSPGGEGWGCTFFGDIWVFLVHWTMRAYSSTSFVYYMTVTRIS